MIETENFGYAVYQEEKTKSGKSFIACTSIRMISANKTIYEKLTIVDWQLSYISKSLMFQVSEDALFMN